MPKEKSARRSRKTAQAPARRSARQSTRASTRSSTASTPSSTQAAQSQPDSLASQSLNDLLDLVRQQVRAEMQAQQTEAGRNEATQQAATSTVQPTAITPQPAAAALGALPPPHLLTSVSLAAASQTASPITTPAQNHSTASSGAATTATQLPVNPPLPQLPQTSSNAGVILSPAAEPFPRKLVDKVKSGQFVEMRELLADNITLLSQLEAIQGVPPLQILGGARPRLREVSSLSTWCYCFLGYAAILTSDPTTRDQLAYARLIIREALRHGGSGWLDYDRAFRQQASADPSLRWNTLLPALQASTMLSFGPGQGAMFCTLCRGVDHTRTQCALLSLHPPANRPPNTPPTTPKRKSDNICISWNRGLCIFPGICGYRHVCATCHLPHKAKDCSKTPDGSIYKQQRGPPQQPSPHTPPTALPHARP